MVKKQKKQAEDATGQSVRDTFCEGKTTFGSKIPSPERDRFEFDSVVENEVGGAAYTAGSTEKDLTKTKKTTIKNDPVEAKSELRSDIVGDKFYSAILSLKDAVEYLEDMPTDHWDDVDKAMFRVVKENAYEALEFLL